MATVTRPLPGQVVQERRSAGLWSDAFGRLRKNRLAILGLWSFTNLETAYALLRVQERRVTFLRASLANVLLTVGLTVTLVVVLDGGAHGYLAGNYVASAIVPPRR